MKIDQLVFGYRDGHRQLAGSTDLNREVASAILGATDAAVSVKDDHLITGMPFPKLSIYAFSVTWPAPEAGRPGAVWAHTLLISFDDLSQLPHPASLISYTRRPKTSALDSYRQPIPIDLSEHVSFAPDASLLKVLFSASRASESATIVVHPDLRKAEQTLLLLWDAAWPALRSTFAFRTRSTLRSVPDSPFVGVARQVTGLATSRAIEDVRTDLPPGQVFEPAQWIAALIHGSQEGPDVRRFLQEFGPDEPPQLSSFFSLGELFEYVTRGNVDVVMEMLEVLHPKQQSGSHLKAALFGDGPRNWWTVSDLQLVSAILTTPGNVFDVKALRLSKRLASLIDQGHVTELLEARSGSRSAAIRRALVDALVERATVDTLLAVARLDEPLAFEVLKQRRDLATDAQFWRLLSSAEAEAILPTVPLTNEILFAVAQGGKVKALLNHVSFPEILARIAAIGGVRLVRRIAEALPLEASVAAADSDDARLLLGAATTGVIELTDLLGALERRRHTRDEYWLRSAVSALAAANSKRAREVLEVVFGPVHRAIAEDRLPGDLWARLSPLLPKANNPARRVRRFLIDAVKEDGWDKRSVERALRDSGPDIALLRDEVKHEDEVWRLIKSGLKAAGRPA